MGKLVVEAGFPPGVINFISGGGETGHLLASHMDINKIALLDLSNPEEKYSRLPQTVTSSG